MVAAATHFIPPSLHVDALLVADDGVIIRTSSDTTAVQCPVCGDPADRIHSRAIRTLADLPWAGIVVRLQVQFAHAFAATRPARGGSSVNGSRALLNHRRGAPSGSGRRSLTSPSPWAERRALVWRRSAGCRSVLTRCCGCSGRRQRSFDLD